MVEYAVYIVTNKPRGVLYIGVTNNLSRRIYEHTTGIVPGFTTQYKLHRLVYVEKTTDIREAIRREKQLKNWHRVWKVNLIESVNPRWDNLVDMEFSDPETSSG